MWVASLKIINYITNTEEDIIYRMNRITKYLDLYRNLPQLLKSKHNYRPKQVTFTFKYLDKNILVDEWTKYILNRDVIEIRIFKTPIIYTLVDSYNGNILSRSDNKKIIYRYYTNNIKKYDWPIFVKMDNCLIDVLDKPENYLNLCINRLIHRYNF